MSVTLILDSTALNALFPEGTELRAKLVTSALEEFINKSLKPHKIDAEIRQEIDSARQRVIDELMKNDFTRIGYGKFVLSSQVAESVRNSAREAVRNAIEEEARAVFKEMLSKEKLQELVSAEISMLANRAIATSFTTAKASEVLGKAISELLTKGA